MKKIFTFLLLIAPILTYSQGNKLTFGLEGGLNLSGIRASQNYFLDKSTKIGVLSGLTIQYPITSKIDFKSGLYYENKGSKGVAIRVTDANGTILGDVNGFSNFNYLHVPFLFKTTLGAKTKFFANVGPNIGLLLKQTTSVEQTEEFIGFKENLTDRYKKIELGISGGLGFAIPLNKRAMLSFEIRDNLGLTNVNKVNGISEKTNSVNFLFGFARIL